MHQEQPLVTWGEIAKFLKVGKKKAKQMVTAARVPIIEAYRPFIAVWPSDLRSCLSQKKKKRKR